jgi:hypothetical protein
MLSRLWQSLIKQGVVVVVELKIDWIGFHRSALAGCVKLSFAQPAASSQATRHVCCPIDLVFTSFQ